MGRSRVHAAGLLVVCLLSAVVAGGVLAGTAVASPGAVSDSPAAAHGEVEVLVELSDHGKLSSASEFRAHAARSQAGVHRFARQTTGVSLVTQFWVTNAALVRVDTDRVPLRALARVDGVQSVQRNARVQVLDRQGTAAGPGVTTATTGESSDNTTYGVAQVGAPEAWSAYDTRGGNTSVAVLDTGVDPGHPDISLAGWAEFDGNGNRLDTQPQEYSPSGHGTHASGTVVGGNASGQYIGVAPNASLYHGAVLTNCNNGACTGTLSQIIAGIQWAVDQNVDVVSMSLGAEGYYDDFVDPVRNAQAAGTTVVAAVGNNGEGNSSSPANVYDAISVGAVDRTRTVTSFSSGESIDTSAAWGPTAPLGWPANYTVPTVTAAGSFVTSATPGGGYGEKSGTSMATPHVAGAVALVQSATTERLSPEELESSIEAAATKPDGWSQPETERDTRYGRGVVDVPGAIVTIQGPGARFGTGSTPQVGTGVGFDATNSTGTIRQYTWDFDGDGDADRTTTDPRTNYTFTEPGEHPVTLTVTDSEGHNGTRTRTVTARLPPVAERPPRDVDGDGLYGDVRGDGSLSLLDVQALFDNLDNPAVQDNADSFDFSNTGGRVTVLDVQALFDDL